MKQHLRIKKNICTLVFFLFVSTLVYTAPGDTTPNPTDGATLVPTASTTQAPIQEPTPTPSDGAPDQMFGDVNTDNKINIIDALLIAQYFVGMNPNNFNAAVANVNNDDKIDIIDSLLVAQYYVGILPGF